MRAMVLFLMTVGDPTVHAALVAVSVMVRFFTTVGAGTFHDSLTATLVGVCPARACFLDEVRVELTGTTARETP